MRSDSNSYQTRQHTPTLSRAAQEEEETHNYGRRNIQIVERVVLFSVSFLFVLAHRRVVAVSTQFTYARRERLDAMRNECNKRGRMDEIIAVKNYSQCFLV